MKANPKIFLFLTALIAAFTLGAILGGRYAIAPAAGLSVWRVDRLTGRVSLCVRAPAAADDFLDHNDVSQIRCR